MTSATVSGIRRGSSGGSSSRLAGVGGIVEVASRLAAAVTAPEGQGGHGEHGMAHQRSVAPDLAVVPQAELVLADLKILLHRPAHPRDPDQSAQGEHPAVGQEQKK